MLESVVPATTWIGLCTRALADGVQTVTDGFVVLSGHDAKARAEMRVAEKQANVRLEACVASTTIHEQLQAEVVKFRDEPNT